MLERADNGIRLSLNGELNTFGGCRIEHLVPDSLLSEYTFAHLPKRGVKSPLFVRKIGDIVLFLVYYVGT